MGADVSVKKHCIIHRSLRLTIPLGGFKVDFAPTKANGYIHIEGGSKHPCPKWQINVMFMIQGTYVATP